MGFCYGVKRAIKIATAAAEKNGSAVTLGPLIHNPQVVNRLEKEGVHSVKSLNNVKNKEKFVQFSVKNKAKITLFYMNAILVE